MNNIVKIKKITQITHDVKQFETEKPKGYKFTPGQATDIAINKVSWKDKKHPFTFTSLNSDNFLQFTIKGYPVSIYPEHEGVTEQIHNLKVGDEFIIEEPWGVIKYNGSGIFIAGGAGLTPFITIFKQLKKDREIKKNKLFFSNKTSSDVILENNLREWFNNNNLILTLTRENNDKYLNSRIDQKFLKKHVQNYNQHFYVCGKKQMVKDLTNYLQNLGAKTESIIFEK
jgi:hypothetical protein